MEVHKPETLPYLPYLLTVARLDMKTKRGYLVQSFKDEVLRNERICYND